MATNGAGRGGKIKLSAGVVGFDVQKIVVVELLKMRLLPARQPSAHHKRLRCAVVVGIASADAPIVGPASVDGGRGVALHHSAAALDKLRCEPPAVELFGCIYLKFTSLQSRFSLKNRCLQNLWHSVDKAVIVRQNRHHIERLHKRRHLNRVVGFVGFGNLLHRIYPNNEAVKSRTAHTVHWQTETQRVAVIEANHLTRNHFAPAV